MSAADLGKCDVCRKPISGALLQLGDKNMHPECHKCYSCKRVFAEDETFARDGSKHAICGQCTDKAHAANVAAKPPMESEVKAGDHVGLGSCGSCGKGVSANAVTVQGSVYHPPCFACMKCKKTLGKGDGFVREGQEFLCEDCC